MSLVVNGYSESQLRASLKELGLPYSEEELDKIRDQLMDKLTDFKQRELPEEAFALFIEGYLKYPPFIKYVTERVENYLCFLRYPEEIKRHIYSTNRV